MWSSVDEEWCRAALGKGGVEKCWGRVVVQSSIEEGRWRQVLGKSGVEKCWGRVV